MPFSAYNSLNIKLSIFGALFFRFFYVFISIESKILGFCFNCVIYVLAVSTS